MQEKVVQYLALAGMLEQEPNLEIVDPEAGDLRKDLTEKQRERAEYEVEQMLGARDTVEWIQTKRLVDRVNRIHFGLNLPVLQRRMTPPAA